MSKRWFCFLLSLLLAVLPLAQVSASAVSSPQILYSVNYTPYTEQELLNKAHANVDERSESLKQLVSMIPRAEVSGDSVAFARNASSPEYATQLLSRKVFDNGTTEETYATTAVFTARTNTGSGSTSDNQVFTSYTLYATIYYSYRYDDLGVNVIFKLTSTKHRVSYGSDTRTPYKMVMNNMMQHSASGVPEFERTGTQYSPVSLRYYTLSAPSGADYRPMVSCTLAAGTYLYTSSSTTDPLALDFYVDCRDLR